jgi:hypothetical protein
MPAVYIYLYLCLKAVCVIFYWCRNRPPAPWGPWRGNRFAFPLPTLRCLPFSDTLRCPATKGAYPLGTPTASETKPNQSLRFPPSKRRQATPSAMGALGAIPTPLWNHIFGDACFVLIFI